MDVVHGNTLTRAVISSSVKVASKGWLPVADTVSSSTGAAGNVASTPAFFIAESKPGPYAEKSAPLELLPPAHITTPTSAPTTMTTLTMPTVQAIHRRRFGAGDAPAEVVGGAPGGVGGSATAVAVAGLSVMGGLSAMDVSLAGADSTTGMYRLKRTRTNGTLECVIARARDRSFVHASPDHALAERLERFAASDVRRFAETAAALFAGEGGEFLEVGGGVASYVGPHSPANGAIGLGFCGEVTHGQIATVERFFLDRGEEPIASVCPVAHPSLVRVLGERGWVVGTFENVLVREVRAEDSFDPPAPGVSCAAARGRDELNDWALMAARGFSAPQEPTEPELRLATVATHRVGAIFLFGMVDGVRAGTGQLEIADDIGWLSGDTTLPPFRRHGVQGTLQRARLELARDAGCSLAVTESVPGSASQRNMERLGFRVAYTRVDAKFPSFHHAATSKGTDS